MADDFHQVRVDRCESRLELNLKVSGLRNYDLVGKSDPFAVVYVNNSSSAALPVSLTAGTGTLQAGGGAAGLGRGRGGPPLAGGAPRGGAAAAGRGGRGGLNRRSARSVLSAAGAQISNITAPLPSVQPVGRPRQAMRSAPWEHVTTTETVRNALEASFSTTIPISYFFERAQQIVVDVYDRDSNSSNLVAHDYLGSAFFTVSELVRAEELCLRVPLRMLDYPLRRCGFLTVVGEDTSNRHHIVHMTVGVTLRKKPRFLRRRWGPYLVFSRRASTSNSEWITKYSSTREGSVVSSQRGAGVTYVFEEERVPFEALMQGNMESELRVSVVFKMYDTEQVYARACVRVNEWLNRSVALSGGRLMQRTRGTLALQRFDVREQPLFMDYVMGGAEIGLMVAIDFTASNGDPVQPGTLHYLNMYQPNEYETAIRSVGDILAQYDADNEIPVFGFGAKIPPSFEHVSHYFSLTGASDPVCVGIDGVLDAYRGTLNQVRLSGPSEFAGIIEHAARYAEYERTKCRTAFTILLILTDGIINDYNETARAIARASQLPLSIVIVGVGDADFTAMNALDGDHLPRQAQWRDIVQFVPFRRYQHQPEMLAAQVLAEIPKQLEDYFAAQGIMPGDNDASQAQAQSQTHGAPPPPRPFADVPFVPESSMSRDNVQVSVDATQHGPPPPSASNGTGQWQAPHTTGTLDGRIDTQSAAASPVPSVLHGSSTYVG